MARPGSGTGKSKHADWYKTLKPFFVDSEPDSSGQINGWCPIHEKSKGNGHKGPSATFNLERGVWTCFSQHCEEGFGSQVPKLVTELNGKSLNGTQPKTDPATYKRKAIYKYQDEHGKVLFEVVRSESPDGQKRFKQRHQEPDGTYISNIRDIRRVLYRLPKVRKAITQGVPIYLPEGEKDVHTIEGAGGAATTNPGGAEKWSDEYSQMLRGASEIIIVADRDGPGERHALKVQASLNKADIPNRIVQARHGKDATDHLDEGFDLGDFDPFEPSETTDFRHVDLDSLFKPGGMKRPEPTLLEREDGKYLLYKRQLHWFQAEPEAGKSWLAIVAADELLRSNRIVVYFDWEDSVEAIVGRLVDLGVPEKKIKARFRYISPSGAITDDVIAMLEADELPGADLVVIDACTEAMVSDGLDPNDNMQVHQWIEGLPRAALRAGAAVVVNDHVVKRAGDRGRYAIGGQQKLAYASVAYGLRIIKPFAPGVIGMAMVEVEKDRAGSVRAYALERRQVAKLVIDSTGEKTLAFLEVPEEGKVEIQKVGGALKKLRDAEHGWPRSKRDMVALIGGHRANALEAIEQLIGDGKLVEAAEQRKGHPLYELAPDVEVVSLPEDEDDE